MLARFYRSILALVVFVMTVSGKVAQATPADDDEALFRIWLRAFAEMKRGDLQADEEHWPKAIAKYRSALKGFEELKADFPHYQEEIVAFRMGDLLSRLTEAQQVLILPNGVVGGAFSEVARD